MEHWSKEKLIEELKKKESENERLQEQLKKCQENFTSVDNGIPIVRDVDSDSHRLPTLIQHPLSHEQVARYSRQLILPEFGPRSQQKLSSASVLIVGCGGLGCPAAIYLAAAGVGRLGLIDYDTVELSNLHRQVLHTESRIGVSKAASIAMSVKALNSNIETVPYEVPLTSTTAMQIIRMYDIILDCTDNVATRYLLNDACVLANKPLVSGSALRYEGQLTVYHYEGGPCFRCIHPKPPPPETVTNCSDGGVLGVVPGIIGCLQALEATKIASGLGNPLSQKLLLFEAKQGIFRTVKLRGSRKTCEICGETPSITKLIDYEQFCGAAATDKDKGLTILAENKRITVEKFNNILNSDTPHVLIDIRLPVELEICALPNSLNIPLQQIAKPENITTIKERLSHIGTKSIYCVCRRGNDSQLAVSKLESTLGQEDLIIKDLVGGLTAWANKIDPSMPVY